MNDDNSNATQSTPDVQNSKPNTMHHSIANVATDSQCSSHNADPVQMPSSTQNLTPSSPHSIQCPTKHRRKTSQESSCLLKWIRPCLRRRSNLQETQRHSLHSQEQPLVANALAAVHENEQAMNTTAPPFKNKDEALNPEVYENLERHDSVTSVKCQAYETLNNTPSPPLWLVNARATPPSPNHT